MKFREPPEDDMTKTNVAPGEAIEEAPRWIQAAAWATPACVLPSSLWRLFAISHLPAGCPDGNGTHAYVIGLSTVSFLAAFATVGLVRPWGRVLPQWVPGLGGRPIKPKVALAMALTGIVLLTVVYLYAFLNPVFGWREPNDDIPGCPPPDNTDGAWIAYLSYAPILAWLPLLMLVTGDFYRRTMLRGNARGAA